MPRIPISVQQGNFGSQNAGAPATARSVPQALVKMPAGVAQARQRFTGLQGIDPTLARMLDQMQQDIATAQRLLKAVPFLDGNLIQGLSFGSGTAVTISHGLGRLWRGYMPCNFQGNSATFYAILQGPSNLTIGGADARTLVLTNTSTTSGKFDCWVW